MTFDQAQERFRENPFSMGAILDYLQTATEYWNAEMIGDDTFVAALTEITTSVRKTQNHDRDQHRNPHP